VICYAQLNENGICTGVSQLSGQVEQANMVEIPAFDAGYLWKQYDRVTDTWSMETFEPVSTAPLNDFEQMRADLDQVILSLL
jgi:hypothetical protein